MSEDQADVTMLLENAENMIAEGLDGLAQAQKHVAVLKNQLAGCEVELAESKAKLAKKAAAGGPDVELLREFVEAVSGDRVSGFASRHGYVGDAWGSLEGLATYHTQIARAVLGSHPKTLTAWLAKYYPISADKVPKEQAARASLKRWRGQTPEVLAAYGLTKHRGGVAFGAGDDVFQSGRETCPLCRYFFSQITCGDCVLAEVAQYPCSHGGPYAIWRDTGDAAPMIAALEKAVEVEEKRDEKVAVVLARDAVGSVL